MGRSRADLAKDYVPFPCSGGGIQSRGARGEVRYPPTIPLGSSQMAPLILGLDYMPTLEVLGVTLLPEYASHLVPIFTDFSELVVLEHSPMATSANYQQIYRNS